jgi:hypothetical protein
MRIIACIEDPAAIEKMLAHLDAGCGGKTQAPTLLAPETLSQTLGGGFVST